MSYVRASGVWKRFILQKDRADSVGQLLLRMLPGRNRRTIEPFWALRDVSFEVPHGTSLGLIGHNGAGKSTMLKVLTRTLQPTRGSLSLQGRVSALIELGAGFHPDFTGRENIILNASILGVRRREVEQRMDDIIDFSGIRPFIDTPVKYYSSGMHARLGFSVAIHVHPEILIIDEVLAVGDAAFQRQCMDRIFRLKRDGVSILLVSHDLASVERLMDQAVWLDHGQVRMAGDPRTVVAAYRATTDPPRSQAAASVSDGGSPTGPHLGRILAVPHPGSATPLSSLASNDALTVLIPVVNPSAHPFTGFIVATIRRPDGLIVAECSGADDGVEVRVAPTSARRHALTLPHVALAGGTYDIEIALIDRGGQRIHATPRMTIAVVGGPRGGLLALPHEWCEPSGMQEVEP